ncbi:MAG: 30S ribosomal protein S6 [bacterium]|nr:30S ribosomal protein S6 [bacterium]
MTTETVKTEGTVYEVGYHIVPAVSPDNLSVEVDAIKAVLGKNGATIISEEAPQLMPLSYEMVKVAGQTRNKYDTAYFGWIKFEAAPAAVVEINKALSVSEKILRYLLIKTVRDNTMVGEKLFAKEKEEAAKAEDQKEAAKTDKPKASEEEIDKSIEKLVA